MRRLLLAYVLLVWFFLYGIPMMLDSAFFASLSDLSYFAIKFSLYALVGILGCLLLRKHDFTAILSLNVSKIGLGFTLLGFLGLLCWNILASTLFPISNNGNALSAYFSEEMSQVLYILSLVQLVVLGPFVEEVICRGIIVSALSPVKVYGVAALVSSIVFSMGHNSFSEFQFPDFIRYFGSGMLLYFVKIKTGSLSNAIVLHMLWNGFVFGLVNLVM